MFSLYVLSCYNSVMADWKEYLKEFDEKYLKPIVEKWDGLSKKKKAYVSAFSAVVGLLLWAFISAGLITHDFNRNQLASDKDRQEAKINGIILTETKDHKKYWELYGESGDYDSKNEVALLNNVVGNFYKDDKVAMSFQSSKGTYNARTKIIVLYEDTFVVLEDGTTLRADQLHYAGSDKPVVAYGNVEITRGNAFLALAEEIEISPNYESFKIIGKTVSKIYEEKK